MVSDFISICDRFGNEKAFDKNARVAILLSVGAANADKIGGESRARTLDALKSIGALTVAAIDVDAWKLYPALAEPIKWFVDKWKLVRLRGYSTLTDALCRLLLYPFNKTRAIKSKAF